MLSNSFFNRNDYFIDIEPYVNRFLTGIAAGAHYTHTGGGANLLCLEYNVTYNSGQFIDDFQGKCNEDKNTIPIIYQTSTTR